MIEATRSKLCGRHVLALRGGKRNVLDEGRFYQEFGSLVRFWEISFRFRIVLRAGEEVWLLPEARLLGHASSNTIPALPDLRVQATISRWLEFSLDDATLPVDRSPDLGPNQHATCSRHRVWPATPACRRWSRPVGGKQARR